jgi:hypothetical protein
MFASGGKQNMAGTHTTSRPTGFAEETTSTEGSSKVGEIASKAQDAAGAAAGTLKEHGSELQKTAKDKVARKADDSRTMAVEKARTLESDLRDLTSSVREKQPQVADALETAIDKAGSVITYVENTSIEDITSDLGRQARQRPWLVLGGMFAAGFLLSRAVKPVDGVLDQVTSGSKGGSVGNYPTTTPKSTLSSPTGSTSGQLPRTTGSPLHV